MGPRGSLGARTPLHGAPFQKTASAVGAPAPAPERTQRATLPQQQWLTSPCPSAVARAVWRVGRSLCSTSGDQELRAGGGRAPLLGPGPLPRCRARALASTGGWGSAVCPRLGSIHGWPHLSPLSREPSPETKARSSAWCLALQAGTTRWPAAPPRWVWSTCPGAPASQRGRQGHGSKGLSSAGDEGRAGQA